MHSSECCHYIWLLLWNCWTKFNETWQVARSQRPIPSLCFLGRSENKMSSRASDWLRHFRLLLWNRWTEFDETWQEGRSQCPLPSLCFSGQSEKQDCRPGLWLAEIFSTSPLKLLNGIQWNLTGSKISTSSTKFVFSEPIGKTRWPPWPLIGWDIFDALANPSKRWHIVLRCTIYCPFGLLFGVCCCWGHSQCFQNTPWLCPPLKKEGHITLHMSVSMSVGRYVGIPNPCATDNSRMFCPRSFKLGR